MQSLMQMKKIIYNTHQARVLELILNWNASSWSDPGVYLFFWIPCHKHGKENQKYLNEQCDGLLVCIFYTWKLNFIQNVLSLTEKNKKNFLAESSIYFWVFIEKEGRKSKIALIG